MMSQNNWHSAALAKWLDTVKQKDWMDNRIQVLKKLQYEHNVVDKLLQCWDCMDETIDQLRDIE